MCNRRSLIWVQVENTSESTLYEFLFRKTYIRKPYISRSKVKVATKDVVESFATLFGFILETNEQ